MLSLLFTGFYTGFGRLYKFCLGSSCTGPITVDFSPIDFDIRCGFFRDSVTIRDAGTRVITRYCGTSPPVENPIVLTKDGNHWITFASFFSFRSRSTGFTATVCDIGPTSPIGPSPWPSWNTRSHGHLHEGQPLYIHTYTCLTLCFRGVPKSHSLRCVQFTLGLICLFPPLCYSEWFQCLPV